MTTAVFINSACWLVFLLYWVWTARKVKPDAEVKTNFRYVRWIIFLVAFVLLRPKGIAGHTVATTLLPHSAALLLLSVLFSIAGVVIAIMARRKLAGNWSSGVVLKQGHELITTGIYTYVRHPIYSGILLIALGTAVVYGTLPSIMFFVFVLFFMMYKAVQEEQLLTEHFREYPVYRARTKRIIPFVW
jgi:protein-S-isoprenylcysteine O-methyltransferase Ste14